MISTDGTWFKDEHGRSLLLRGVNLGASTKLPFRPDGATWNKAGFYDHRNVSFVGRPFPLEQADEHFARLRQWGLTFLRFLTTWEAVEHAGPGLYDQEYLDYLHAVIQKAGEYGLSMFIDPHQDVWSRFSGGDGAPGWTFEAAGMDLTKFHASGAAILYQEYGDPFPRMVWPSNASKLACATLFSLFFAGNDFAPQTRVDDQPIQDYLQGHYIAAMQQVARRLKDLPNVIGYDSLNEPSAGWIGVPDLNQFASSIKIGECPSPFQSMLLGSGYPQDIEVWEMRTSGAKLLETRTVNPEKLSVWLPGRECVWKANGVWEVDSSGKPRLLRPKHFANVNGHAVDFDRDYLCPFIDRYVTAIRQESPQAYFFVESEPTRLPPAWCPEDVSHIVSAPHWYDGLVLFMKEFLPWMGLDFIKVKVIFGAGRIRRSYSQQLESFKKAARERIGEVPTLIGEIGIPCDLQDKKAFRSGNFKNVIRAMDRSLQVMEDTLLNYTIWNYNADNTNARGDGWNDEDLSIFSRDQQKDPQDINSGGRALEAVVRPYARATAGEPLRMHFDIQKKAFEFEFRHDARTGSPSEFFIPNLQYPDGCRVQVSDGTYEIDLSNQLLTYRHSHRQAIHQIVVKRL